MPATKNPQKVTVIPADGLIAVDGESLIFSFSAPADLHALHWNGSAVAVETISPSGVMANADIKAMAIAARAHVMACFAAEAAIQPTLADLPTLDAVAAAFAAALAQVKEASQ